MQPVGRVGNVEAAAVVVHGVCGWGSFGVGNSGWMAGGSRSRVHVNLSVLERRKSLARLLFKGTNHLNRV